jgi:hypothetical protein
MKVTEENRRTGRNTCPSASLFTADLIWTDMESSPGLCNFTSKIISNYIRKRTYLLPHRNIKFTINLMFVVLAFLGVYAALFVWLLTNVSALFISSIIRV